MGSNIPGEKGNKAQQTYMDPPLTSAGTCWTPSAAAPQHPTSQGPHSQLCVISRSQKIWVCFIFTFFFLAFLINLLCKSIISKGSLGAELTRRAQDILPLYNGYSYSYESGTQPVQFTSAMNCDLSSASGAQRSF